MLIPNTSWNSSGDRCLFRQGKTGTVSEWCLKLDLRSCLCSEKHWLLTWTPVIKAARRPGPFAFLCLSFGSNSYLVLYIGLTVQGHPSLSMTLEDNQCKDKS